MYYLEGSRCAFRARTEGAERHLAFSATAADWYVARKYNLWETIGMVPCMRKNIARWVREPAMHCVVVDTRNEGVRAERLCTVRGFDTEYCVVFLARIERQK